MFRVTLGLATATFIALAASPASAGGCCGSNWLSAGWGVNNWGCCSSYASAQPYAYAQPQYYVQPAPQIYVQPAPPVFVQAPPQQIIVQQPQPEVFFQQAAIAPVPTYTVNHGPHYAGPELIGYPETQYHIDRPVRPYPYVSGGYYKPRYYGRPHYRSWKYGHRPYRHYGVYRPHRHAAYHHRRHAVAPHVYVGPKKKYWH
jgi:hypothetical protein